MRGGGVTALTYFDAAMSRLHDLTNRPLSEEALALIAAMRACLVKGDAVTPAYFAQAVALLPAEERRGLLRDYGFECGCPLCVEETEAKVPVPGPTPGVP